VNVDSVPENGLGDQKSNATSILQPVQCHLMHNADLSWPTSRSTTQRLQSVLMQRTKNRHGIVSSRDAILPAQIRSGYTAFTSGHWSIWRVLESTLTVQNVAKRRCPLLNTGLTALTFCKHGRKCSALVDVSRQIGRAVKTYCVMARYERAPSSTAATVNLCNLKRPAYWQRTPRDFLLS